MDKTRRGAFLVLRDVEENKAYTNIALSNYIKRVGPPNVPLLRELVYGVVRQKLYLDWVIGNFVKTPISKLHTAERILLRLGLYQLIFLNSIPDYAAVDETVELSKTYARGREKFINGVLRQYQRDKDYIDFPPRAEGEIHYLATKHSFEPWIVSMWLDLYGSERTEHLLEALNKTPRLCIRANTLKTDAPGLADRLGKLGFKTEQDSDLPNLLFVAGEGLLATNLYTTGLFSVQDKASQTVVECLDAKPGDTVVDVCAAPGGKAMAIAEDMENVGRIIATDIYKRKVELIEAEAKRLGVKIVEPWSWDARVIDSELIGIADKVLADVPCSGLGTARRKPEVKYKDLDSEMKNLPQLQLDILKTAAHYVRPGGVLVYSTCTIAQRENEDVVMAFLKNNVEFEMDDKVQLLPSMDETDGFFICRMKRVDRHFAI